MIRFDRETLKKWQESGVTDIRCEFIPKGCEGTTLIVSEWTWEWYELIEIQDSPLQCHIDKASREVLNGSFVTHTRGKWILSSDNVLAHCGCGKSFQAKTGNPKIDKIRLLRSKLEKRNHTH